MKQNVFVRVFAIVMMILFILLTAYHIVLLLTPLTDKQQQVFDFLRRDSSHLNLSLTIQEAGHLMDVRFLMGNVTSGWFLLIIITGIMFWRLRKQKEMIMKLFYWSGLTIVVLNVVLLFSGLFFFEQLFVGFHLLFFPQGNWQFPIDSLLIQTFPASFFLVFALWLFLFNVVIGIGLFLIGWRMKKSH